MKKKIAKAIWDFSENYKIPLGKYAPSIFGWMVGSKPIKIITKKDIAR